MADDGETAKQSKTYDRPQETFHRTQEVQVEQKFPGYATGIVPLPPGSRGPKSLYIKRNGDSFGFTLRHFIVYPPDSITSKDGRHAAVGALSTPMETIFVFNVKEGTPAQKAGLQCGDRLVGVNRIAVTGKSYQEVVQLIQNSPDYLHLFVVPGEEDLLQRYFADTAYNPASNRYLYDLNTSDSRYRQHYHQNQRPVEFYADAISWRSLQNSYGYDPALYYNNQLTIYDRGQRSADNIFSRVDDTTYKNSEIYAEINNSSNEPIRYTNPRAQPQVPLYKKMGRRASDGCTLSDRQLYYEPSDDYSDLTSYYDTTVNNSTGVKMKTIYNTPQNYLQPSDSSTAKGSNDMSTLRTYPNSVGCRLSLDAGRRESESSLSSSIADGSKDSLHSYDSQSTLTGHETDDSAFVDRLRKSVQQKEEFLRMPVTTTTTSNLSLQQKEFYSRPKKFERTLWPPNEPSSQLQLKNNNNNNNNNISGSSKPIHQHFQRVKNDIQDERVLLSQLQQQQANYNNENEYQSRNITTQQQQQPQQRRNVKLGNVDQTVESDQVNGAIDDDVFTDDKKLYQQSLQVVHNRARQFESGKPLPEDDPILSDRTSFYRSELARISSKKVVPNVTERAHEFETRSNDNTNIYWKKIQRDTRSLESSSDVSESQANKLRARSNSAESWDTVMQNNKKSLEAQRINRQDAITIEGVDNKDNNQQSAELPQYPQSPPSPSPLIPVPVQMISAAPKLSITPATPPILQTTPASPKPVRPSQLYLDGPVRPSRHLKPPSALNDTSQRGPVSPVEGHDNNQVVVKRRTKNTNIADDERAMRRESYLKATEGGRMHFDNEFCSDGDVSSQMLRSAHRRWRPPLFPGDIQQLRKMFEDAAFSLGGSASGNSSSSASLDREKICTSPTEKSNIIKEGSLHCKITEIDGKRFGDRSWKQVWSILRGPKLFLYKDRHHQSPIGTSDAIDQNLSNGIDMRASVVRVAEDYTKRKNVLRVSSVKPCRSEFLLQADNTEELADWVKALQEQMATTTDVEAKLDSVNDNKQQAVPQTVPASTSIQVQGSRLSPQPPNKSKTSSSSRNRSPTGQSPVSKTRKPSQINEPSTSPKSKTWRGRVAKQFRKMQGASSPSSPTAPDGSTFGIPLDHCIPSTSNPYVPKFVEICTDIVDERGLQTVGIYRVPGNNASITGLTEEINRNYEFIPLDDPRWNDLHVVSSLLKSYFRKMPDSLVTNTLYPTFIKADKIDDPELRMKELKRLIKSLPPHNYHTLKHIILHLKRVVDNSDVNKMEAKNLAIVFGPTIVRPEEDNMETMVNNMTHQCKIVETLLTCADWFFSEDDSSCPSIPFTPSENREEGEATNQILLLDNIQKYEALKDKEKNGALFSSIISAAQRKVRRKTKSGNSSLNESKEDTSNLSGASESQYFSNDFKENSSAVDGNNKSTVIPTTVTEMERMNKSEKQPWFNYSTDQEEFHRRIENFKQETNAMLRMSRNLEISVNNAAASKSANLSSSVSNISSQPRLSLQQNEQNSQLLKTHSASNVFNRTTTQIKTDNLSKSNSNSLNKSYKMVQYSDNNKIDTDNHNLRYSNLQQQQKQKQQFVVDSSDVNRNLDKFHSGGNHTRNGRSHMRRGSSVENINSGVVDLNANGAMKKIKFENEDNISQRTGSLDSLNRLAAIDDGIDLVASLTKLYDEKKEKHLQSIMLGEDLPFVDESPEKAPKELIPSSQEIEKENIPNSTYLYRNPSLHKNHFTAKEMKDDNTEKDEDSTLILENVPDNGKYISTSHHNNKLTLILNNNTNKVTGSKLKRSESLNKPDRTVSPMHCKIRRSESLNKTGDKLLKRSDSLTKTEKTENNLNKRRELSTSRRTKDVGKLKRKNGMPDRSIKRRHTVGGTKDPDKVTWLDNKYHEDGSNKENKEKNLRTSSPDLSTARRERLFLEIIAPENMVMALRQHLIGTRPQSFPESAVFKVPLESHV